MRSFFAFAPLTGCIQGTEGAACELRTGGGEWIPGAFKCVIRGSCSKIRVSHGQDLPSRQILRQPEPCNHQIARANVVTSMRDSYFAVTASSQTSCPGIHSPPPDHSSQAAPSAPGPLLLQNALNGFPPTFAFFLSAFLLHLRQVFFPIKPVKYVFFVYSKSSSRRVSCTDSGEFFCVRY